MEEVNPIIQEEPLIPIRRPLTFWKGVLYGLVILGSQMVVAVLVLSVASVYMGIGDMDMEGSIEERMAELMPQMIDLVMGIVLPLSFLLAVFILLRRRKLHPTALQWRSSFFKLLPIGLLMLFGFNYIVGELMTYLPNYEQMLADYKTMFEGINMQYLLIGGVFVGPICEEIIFRGIIQEGFIHTYDGPRALLYSAIIFGVIHLMPLQVINAFLAGILLGWIYWKTRSLWIVMILHILNNYVAFQSTELDANFMKEMVGNDVLYALTFPLVALLMYGGYRLFDRIASEENA